MRSPSTTGFPSRASTGLVAILLAVSGCTQDRPASDRAEPTAPPAQTATAQPGSPRSDEGGGGGQREAVTVTDEKKRRTTRGEGAPAYVELASARVEGTPDALTFTVALAGPVPRTMPNGNSTLRVTFTVIGKGGAGRYRFDAQCIQRGWGAFASGGTDEGYLPELAVGGKSVTLSVDPAYLGGLRAFDWLANVAWTEGRTAYAFDSIPESGFATFP